MGKIKQQCRLSQCFDSLVACVSYGLLYNFVGITLRRNVCIDTHTLCILLLMHIIVQISKGVLLGLQTQSRLKNASRSKLE